MAVHDSLPPPFTLPRLGMPSSGAFSSLFPPILDLQTRDPIATRDAAEAAGTAGPSFAVPRLPPDPEPFVLRDIDGDGRDGARLLAALEGEGEGESEAEDDNVEEDDRKDWKTRRRERIEPIDDVWKRAWEPAPTPAFELRDWDTGPRPPFLPPAEGTPALAFEALSTEPQVRSVLALPVLSAPRDLPPPDAAGALALLVEGETRWSNSKGRFVASKRGLGARLAIPSAMRRVEIIVEDDGPALTPTHHALQHALAALLAYMRARLVDPEPPLEEIADLGAVLCDVVCWPLSEPAARGLPARPASLLTHIYTLLGHHLATPPPLEALALAFLLQHASAPWLAQLHAWIGVVDTTETEDSKQQPWTDLGITRVRTPSGWEYEFSRRRMPMPAFVAPATAQTFFDAGRALRALRDASGGRHPLCWTEWPMKAAWGWGPEEGDGPTAPDLSAHARSVQRKIECWRVAEAHAGPGPRSRTTSAAEAESQVAPFAGADWLAAAQPAPPPPLTGFISAPPPALPVLDPLSFFTYYADRPLLHTPLPEHAATALSPPLAHATLLSRALVAHYLDDLHLLDHLDVLRAFWLGGDAGFAERVSGALFVAHASGAGLKTRRQRTRARLGIATPAKPRAAAAPMPRTVSSASARSATPAPSVLETPSALGTPEAEQRVLPELQLEPEAEAEAEQEPEPGVGLGIGLSDTHRWPPGGAELTYALRTTLFDHDSALFAARGSVWAGIEDRVSFALRDLPPQGVGEDALRAQWLDPQAIERLDFLYLAYSVPPGIAPLFPPAIIAKYQEVHNFLLRLSRVDAVLRGLYFDILRPDEATPGLGPVPGRTANGSNGSKAKTHQPALLGVYPADSHAAHTLRYLRFIMASFMASFSRVVLDAIGWNCTTMRRRLESLHSGAGAAQSSESASCSVPPSPASSYLGSEDEDNWGHDTGANDPDASDADNSDSQTQLAAVSKLQSAHSLVLYHHIILNRIRRACLLGRTPGAASAFATLMDLLRLILDLGLAVQRVRRGGDDAGEEGARAIDDLRVAWGDTYADFIRALQRLEHSETDDNDAAAAAADMDADADLSTDQVHDDGDARDLELLLRGLGGKAARNDVRDLLLRLGVQTRDLHASSARDQDQVAESECVVLDNKVDERVQMEEIETLTTQVETIPNPSPDSKPPSPSPSSADVRPPSAIDLGSDVELATPAPVVHTHAPRRPVSVHLSPAKGPPRLFPLQSGQDQLSDAQSDDEISLD